jgi:hypothetical protein
MHKFRGGNCIVMVSSVNATALPRDPARRCPWPSVELCSARRTYCVILIGLLRNLMCSLYRGISSVCDRVSGTKVARLSMS